MWLNFKHFSFKTHKYYDFFSLIKSNWRENYIRIITYKPTKRPIAKSVSLPKSNSSTFRLVPSKELPSDRSIAVLLVWLSSLHSSSSFSKSARIVFDFKYSEWNAF